MTHHLASMDDLREAADALREAEVAFVDTEFHSENRYRPQLYLVQIGTPDGRVWIVDPLEDGALAAIAAPLRETPWVVHGGRQDMALLADALGGLPERVWDTQIAAGLVATRFPAPFARLVETWLGTTLDKSATLTNWSRRPLSAAQIAYARGDVQWLRPLWAALSDRVDALGRTRWLAAACDEARDRVLDPPPSDEAWRHIATRWTLPPAGAAILQELAGWRERTARATDQPPRRVVSDGMLIELARRRPTTLGDLAADRRMPRGLLKRHGEALVACIVRASRRPEWAWPRAIGPHDPEGRLRMFLDLVVRAAGAARGWAPDLLLPGLLAEDLILRGARDRRAIAEILGWRDEAIGDLVADALAGEVHVAARGGEVTLSSP